jgi:Phytanoyl-CoA dioxygenase (PhyH)
MKLTIDFNQLGYFLASKALPDDLRAEARNDLLAVATSLLHEPQADLDLAWNAMKNLDRKLGSLLYNSAKLLPSIQRIASSNAMVDQLRNVGMVSPVIADINFRIDSFAEDKFLFDWHQDYWFSVCSPAAVVAWIPLTAVTPETGGVELIPRTVTGGRIFKTRMGTTYNSYADAVVIDEEIPAGPRHRFDMSPGDVLFFRFDVLHRSLPVKSRERSRWTLQVRYADLHDARFLEQNFKPGTVTASSATYLEGQEHVGKN